MAALAGTEAASVSDVSLGVDPPRHTAMPAALASAKVQQVGRVGDVVEHECIN